MTEKLILSHWAKEWSISKSRKLVNRYVSFITFVLILLLVFQIYWVIGNQLSTQLNDLLEKGANLTLKLNTNQKEYRALELRYMQAELDSGSVVNGQYAFKSSPKWEADILENQATNTSLKADLEALSSQIDRNLKVLTAWSSPWYSLIDPEKTDENSAEKPAEEHSPKYQILFDSINKQIEEKETQLNNNQKVEEAVSSKNNPTNIQLDMIKNQSAVLLGQTEDLGLQQTPKAQHC